MQTEINTNHGYSPSAIPTSPRQNNAAAVDESQLTPERLLLLAAGLLQHLASQKLFRGIVIALASSVVAGLGIRAIVRARRRPRPWTERLADKLGIEFDAREAEASIRQVRREVERLRKEVEDRFEHSKAAELLNR